MNVAQLKEMARELSSKLPYQKTKDSPTIKYYTDWQRFEPHLGKPAASETVAPKPWLSRLMEKVEGTTIIVKPDEQTIIPKGGKADISIVNIDASDDDVISLIDPHEGRMLATHIAMLDKAITIRVPEEEKGFARIVLIPPTGGHMPVHIKTIVEKSASLDMEILIGEASGSGLVSLTVEQHLEEYAKLNSLSLLDIDPHSTFYGVKRAVLAPNAINRMNTVITGGYMAHLKDESIQKGVHAEAYLTAGILAYKNERVDYITNTINDSRETTAIINVKGFNLGGFLVNRGTIKATENGYDSVNKLESILIPLTSEGYTVSVPMLEVDTDIVKEGAHSADISGFVEEQLFYLKSRGLTLEEAISLAIQSTILGVLQYSENVPYERAEFIALEIASEFLKKR